MKIKSPLCFAVFWIALTIAGELVVKAGSTHFLAGFIKGFLGGPRLNDFGNTTTDISAAILTCFCPGFLQWILLRRRVRRAWAWVPTVFFGDYLGRLVGWFLIDPLRGRDYEGLLVSAKWLGDGMFDVLWNHEYFLQTYIPVGLAVGIGQYFVLRSQVEKSYLWIAATVAGYALGCIAAAFVHQLFYAPAYTFEEGLIIEFSAGGVMGLCRGAVTVIPLLFWFYGSRS